jgi:hypothetical protein
MEPVISVSPPPHARDSSQRLGYLEAECGRRGALPTHRPRRIADTPRRLSLRVPAVVCRSVDSEREVPHGAAALLHGHGKERSGPTNESGDRGSGSIVAARQSLPARSCYIRLPTMMLRSYKNAMTWDEHRPAPPERLRRQQAPDPRSSRSHSTHTFPRHEREPSFRAEAAAAASGRSSDLALRLCGSCTRIPPAAGLNRDGRVRQGGRAGGCSMLRGAASATTTLDSKVASPVDSPAAFRAGVGAKGEIVQVILIQYVVTGEPNRTAQSAYLLLLLASRKGAACFAFPRALEQKNEVEPGMRHRF